MNPGPPAVSSRIGALDRSPAKAFASGILPGGGQFYTHQPILGIVVLGGVAASAVWALKSTPKTFTDPFGHPYQNGSERKNLVAGAAVESLAIHELPSARGCTYVVPAEDYGLMFGPIIRSLDLHLTVADAPA